MRARVKICGITRRQDAECAVKMGVDALGLVFYPPSPRAVSIDKAQAIINRLPPFISVVGLFVDEDEAEVARCLRALSIDILQFHGDEREAYCQQFNKPYIKAVRMKEAINLNAVSACYPSASAILLDSYQPHIPGGTGEVFDWSKISKIDKPIILAGGLDATNVAMAINQVKPYAVDVSGGVEHAKGIKDPQKINAFMQEVNCG